MHISLLAEAPGKNVRLVMEKQKSNRLVLRLQVDRGSKPGATGRYSQDRPEYAGDSSEYAGGSSGYAGDSSEYAGNSSEYAGGRQFHQELAGTGGEYDEIVASDAPTEDS